MLYNYRLAHGQHWVCECEVSLIVLGIDSVSDIRRYIDSIGQVLLCLLGWC